MKICARPTPLIVRQFSVVNARQNSKASSLTTHSGVPGQISCANAPMPISAKPLFNVMENQLASQKFMLGNRPSAGDFSLYGQLTQLVGFDPTSRAIAHEVSPRTVAWVDLMHDQSGAEPKEQDWIALDDQPESLRGLMEEIGRVYAPAQLANARAVQAGEKTWECEIDGAPWTQQTFPYQAKCLRWTIERYQALADTDRVSVDALLRGTGVDAMLSQG